jgi:hypothetical protein
MGAALGTLGTTAAAAGAAATPIGWGMIAAQAIPEIWKLGTSIRQNQLANKYKRTPRPSYEIPQALKDYLGQAKFNAAVSGLPGQAQLENKLQRQQASSVARSIQSQGSAAERDIAAAAGDYATKQALEDTAYDAARYKSSKMQDLYGAETAMAKQQIAKAEYEQRKPYEDAMAATAALHQSAQENAMTGLEGLTSLFQTAGKAGLLGAGGNAAGKVAAGATVPGTATAMAATPAVAGATPAVSNAMNFGATSDFNQYFGSPNNVTEYNQYMVPGNDLANLNYSFADPNSNRYTYSNANGGYDATDWNTNKTTTVTPTSNSKAFGAIANLQDQPLKNILDYNQNNPNEYDYSQMPIGVMPQQSTSGDMSNYGPGAQRAIRRAGGETSQFNINVPDEVKNNWTNNYFGMEMPTAYGYGNTWNEIMNKIGTQNGLGDMYNEDVTRSMDRLNSRFNPFG